MKILRCVFGAALAVTGAALAPSGVVAQEQVTAQEQAWVQIEAQPSRDKALARAAAYAADFPAVIGFETGPGWHAIVLGPFSPEEAAGALADLRRAGQVPKDAFVTDGRTFGAMIWADGVVVAATSAEQTAAPAADPETPPAEGAVTVTGETAVEILDESPKQARASEAELSKDDRKALQSAMKWYGFYNSTIDGAFGPGTRNSMAAWQEANGYEATGVLTSLQRATLVANHAADLAEFGFETVTETEAGIEITLPLALVAFDHYEPPFAHFAEKDGSGLQIMLISEPGGAEAMAGLYDILQTLQVVPETGPRSLKDKSFTIEGTSAALQSLAYAETRDGTVKGYLVVWKPADAERMTRILPVLQASFRAVGDKALDPGMVPMEDATRSGMLSGLEMRKPERMASGFFVDDEGHVVTSLANVTACTKVTIGADTLAEVVVSDAASGLAVLAPKAPMAPMAIAALASASPRAGSEIVVAGYSYGGQLPAAVLTFGSFDAASGAQGEAGVARLAAPVMAGDVGGPVLDGTGAVIGVLLPAAEGAAKVLPAGMALAADGTTLATVLQSAGITAAASSSSAAASPDALAHAALGMTVLVSCWVE